MRRVPDVRGPLGGAEGGVGAELVPRQGPQRGVQVRVDVRVVAQILRSGGGFFFGRRTGEGVNPESTLLLIRIDLKLIPSDSHAPVAVALHVIAARRGDELTDEPLRQAAPAPRRVGIGDGRRRPPWSCQSFLR